MKKEYKNRENTHIDFERNYEEANFLAYTAIGFLVCSASFGIGRESAKYIPMEQKPREEKLNQSNKDEERENNQFFKHFPNNQKPRN